VPWIILPGTIKYLTTIHAAGIAHARALPTPLSRRDEPPIIRAGIRVKIIQGRRTKARERERERERA
jgi:hypothetical protein